MCKEIEQKEYLNFALCNITKGILSKSIKSAFDNEELKIHFEEDPFEFLKKAVTKRYNFLLLSNKQFTITGNQLFNAYKELKKENAKTSKCVILSSEDISVEDGTLLKIDKNIQENLKNIISSKEAHLNVLIIEDDKITQKIYSSLLQNIKGISFDILPTFANLQNYEEKVFPLDKANIVFSDYLLEDKFQADDVVKLFDAKGLKPELYILSGSPKKAAHLLKFTFVQDILEKPINLKKLKEIIKGE